MVSTCAICGSMVPGLLGFEVAAEGSGTLECVTSEVSCYFSPTALLWFRCSGGSVMCHGDSLLWSCPFGLPDVLLCLNVQLSSTSVESSKLSVPLILISASSSPLILRFGLWIVSRSFWILWSYSFYCLYFFLILDCSLLTSFSVPAVLCSAWSSQ